MHLNTSVDDIRSSLALAEKEGRVSVIELHQMVIAEQRDRNRISVITLLDSAIKRIARTAAAERKRGLAS